MKRIGEDWGDDKQDKPDPAKADQQRRADVAEELGTDLLYPGQIFKDGKVITASTAEEEAVAAVFWLKILDVPLARFQSGKYSVLNACKHIYEHFMENGRRLYNPHSGVFSPAWTMKPKGRKFETTWDFPPGCGERILTKADFEDKPQEPAKKDATGNPQSNAVKPAEGMDTPKNKPGRKKSLTELAMEKFESEHGRAPTLRYRGIILPHE